MSSHGTTVLQSNAPVHFADHRLLLPACRQNIQVKILDILRDPDVVEGSSKLVPISAKALCPQTASTALSPRTAKCSCLRLSETLYASCHVVLGRFRSRRVGSSKTKRYALLRKAYGREL